MTRIETGEVKVKGEAYTATVTYPFLAAVPDQERAEALIDLINDQLAGAVLEAWKQHHGQGKQQT